MISLILFLAFHFGIVNDFKICFQLFVEGVKLSMYCFNVYTLKITIEVIRNRLFLTLQFWNIISDIDYPANLDFTILYYTGYVIFDQLFLILFKEISKMVTII